MTTVNTKIAIVLPNNIWFCPYVSIYTDVLRANHVPYDIISWNRDGSENNLLQFNYVLNARNPFMLFRAYHKFASFVKKKITENNYERLIVFTPQSGIFLSNYLKKKYKCKYIFDYRDLSIEQKFYFKVPFLRVLHNSYANVISSPGFKKYLPKRYNYIISHNFNVESVRRTLDDNADKKLTDNPIDVLTIGGIRDYESNVQVIEHLANVSGFSVRFVGKGSSAGDLQKRAKELKAENVSFVGYYPKEKEKDYISEASFLNIYYPRKPSHDTALSNRFYNSLIYRKPMITTRGTIQGFYAEKYNLGVALDNCENLPEILRAYLSSTNTNLICDNSNKLLRNFLKDYQLWEKMFLNFLFAR